MFKYIPLFLLLTCSSIVISGEMATKVSIKTISNEDYLKSCKTPPHNEIAKLRSGRGRPCKINTNTKLREYVLDQLIQGCSPADIATNWNSKNNGLKTSSSAIYAWITKRSDLSLVLSDKEKKRKEERFKKELNKQSRIPHYITTEYHPEKINENISRTNQSSLTKECEKNESAALPSLTAALKRLTSNIDQDYNITKSV